MRIVVDAARCEGHGQCASKAPGVYAVDEEGYVQVLSAVNLEVDSELARAGARACPVAALSVVDQ